MYVQLIVCVDPAAQLSPPFGETTVIEGGGGAVMVKGASLVSVYAAFVVLVITIV